MLLSDKTENLLIAVLFQIQISIIVYSCECFVNNQPGISCSCLVNMVLSQMEHSVMLVSTNI